MLSGRLEGAIRISGDVIRVSIGCHQVVWGMLSGCLEGAIRLSGVVSRISGGCYQGV